MTQRILFVINHAGFFISHRLPLAIAAKEAGYEVHVATPKSKHVPKVIEAGLQWHRIDLSRSGRNPFREAATIIGLYRLYRRIRPGLVHHVTSKPVLYGTIAARLARVPAVVNAISGLGHVFSPGGALHRLLQRFVSAGYGFALRHPHMRIIFQNEEHRRAFLEHGWCTADQCVLIPGSGVDMSVFRPPAERRHAEPRVVLASRMLYTKGVADFVEAARTLRSQGIAGHFILVGEPDPDNLGSVPEEMLRGWNDEGVVEYAGRREDMANVFRDADIVCLPTFYGEGVPKVLVEAAASGLPIVTTDWPGCRDIVRDGVNGYLVPVRDAGALAQAIERLATSPDDRVRMGQASREHVRERFSLEAVIASTLALYRELFA